MPEVYADQEAARKSGTPSRYPAAMVHGQVQTAQEREELIEARSALVERRLVESGAIKEATDKDREAIRDIVETSDSNWSDGIEVSAV